ncbi:MAG: hypothetical protein ACK4IY_00020 [Chitinophagales bacterium]
MSSNNDSMQRLQMERQRLEVKKAALESAFQNDWQELQNGIHNGSFVRATIKSFFLRKMYNPQFASDAFAAGTARIATEIARRIESFAIAQLEKFMHFIGRKIEDWFDSKEENPEDLKEDTSAS